MPARLEYQYLTKVAVLVHLVHNVPNRVPPISTVTLLIKKNKSPDERGTIRLVAESRPGDSLDITFLKY